MTRSEWVSTLPPWRRLLATPNWRSVYDIEQRTRQLRIETEQLQESNARIARFEQELFSASNPTPSTGVPRLHSQRTGGPDASRAGELRVVVITQRA